MPPESPPRARSPGSPTLLLVPTAPEERALLAGGGLPAGLALRELCGFGAVVAAARAARLAAELRPARVLLVGIAGTYDAQAHPPGEARELSAVALDGIGAGEGEGLLGPAALGFAQWPGTADSARIGERIELAAGPRSAGLLVSACAASASAEEAERRRRRFPGAVAEDLEGFAVAAACQLAGIPLRIVRGLSNPCGERDRARWRTGEALAAARALVLEILESPWVSPGPERR
jgi:futalosine hydrolase